MTQNQAPRAVLSYQLTTLERIGNFLQILDENLQARSYSVLKALAGWFGMEVIENSGMDTVSLQIEIPDEMIPDIQIKKSKSNNTSSFMNDTDWGFINKTLNDHPKVEQFPEEEIPLINEEYKYWYYYVSFTYFWFLYFAITMTEHEPANEFDVNMLEGCHNGWFGQYLSAILIYNIYRIWRTAETTEDLGMSKVKFF